MTRKQSFLIFLQLKMMCTFQVEMDGLTGKVKFDSQGKRTDFELEIVELKKDGLQKVCQIFKIKKVTVNTHIFVQLFRVEKFVLIKCILKISIQNFYLVVKKQI